MTLEQILVFVGGPLAGYLLGSIPFGLIIGLAKGIDIRTRGSGNIGATNLGRILGVKYFFYAFFLDALKGLAPVLTLSLLVNHWHDAGLALPKWAPLLTAVAAVVGHLFPLYLKFKGGKGVATAFGVVLGCWPLFTLAGLGAVLIFIVVFFGWRYISLASITASLAFVALVVVLGNTMNNPLVDTYTPWHDLGPLVAVAGLFALLIIWKHRENIRRLRAGTESRWEPKRR